MASILPETCGICRRIPQSAVRTTTLQGQKATYCSDPCFTQTAASLLPTCKIISLKGCQILGVGAILKCDNCKQVSTVGCKFIDTNSVESLVLCACCAFVTLGLPPAIAMKFGSGASSVSNTGATMSSSSSMSSSALGAAQSTPSLPPDMQNCTEILGRICLEWSRDDAERNLAGQPPGSYYLRAREKRTTVDPDVVDFAITYNDRKTGKLGHSIVSYRMSTMKYSMEGNPTAFASMLKLLQAYKFVKKERRPDARDSPPPIGNALRVSSQPSVIRDNSMHAPAVANTALARSSTNLYESASAALAGDSTLIYVDLPNETPVYDSVSVSDTSMQAPAASRGTPPIQYEQLPVTSVPGVDNVGSSRSSPNISRATTTGGARGMLPPRPSTVTAPSALVTPALMNEPWFHGPIRAEEALQRLQGKPPQTFLVRNSTSTQLALTAVVKDGQMRHAVITHNGVGYQFSGQAAEVPPFDTVQDLVRFLIGAQLLRFPLDKRAFA